MDNTLTFIGDLVKLEKACNLMLLLDAVEEVQV